MRGQTNSSATPWIWVLRRLTGDESGLLHVVLELALALPAGAGDDVVLPRAAAGEKAAESPV